MREILRRNESGIALVTVLLVMMLASALMAGMFAAVASDQRSQGLDRDQSQAYAAAHAGLEKLTTQLAQLFVQDFSPSKNQIAQASATPPNIPNFTFVAPGGGSGYAVTFIADAAGNPKPSPNNDITTGPFAGFKGLITPYTLTVTARSTTGRSEVRLRREVQTVAVPVFQFGIFGERSLSFHAGSTFDFGGRVHTNQHLFLAQQSGSTVTFRDKLTAVGEVVRANLENTNPITSSGHTGTVSIPTVIGSSYRNLAANEGSVSAGPGSSSVEGWKNLSEATYATNIRNTLTGAKRLDLPLVSQGASPIDLIRRPAINSNEHTANPPVFGQRHFSMASLRILLSDRENDITQLPTVTAGTTSLAGIIGGRPVARSIGPLSVTVSAVSGNGTANPPTGEITLTAALPNWLKMPTAPFTIGASTVENCNKVTLSSGIPQMEGCKVSGATTPANTDFTVTLPSGEIAKLKTYSSGTATVGTGKNIRLVSARDLTVAGRVLWAVNGTSSQPITCSGYDSTANKLTLCSWTTAPANGWTLSTQALSAAGQSLLGGYIKIEKQDSNGAWSDVTAEILGLGFAAPNQQGAICGDPTPDAVIRLQRLRDNGASWSPCGYSATDFPTDFWPQVLFDAREGWYRDVGTTTSAMPLGGVINYIALDIANLKRWFAGAIGTTGSQALNNNGYIVYFSDRRGNHDWDATGDPETGEYGNEDSINPSTSALGAGNGVLDNGEDRNENGTIGTATGLETYGARVTNDVAGVVPNVPVAPFNTSATPLTTATNGQARVNRQVLFRRALKLINGGISSGVNNLPDAGLTITAENAVYVQGNYNATSLPTNWDNNAVEPNRPASILADVITILSNDWSDVKSLNSPADRAGRIASNTGYRFAMVAGKSVAFPKPTWAGAGDFGTDGGVHNFLRMLEDWGGRTISYRGSMISLYTARQFIGIYRVHDSTYNPGTRAFSFDTDFLDPNQLPPGTPMFRDVNTLRFRQILRPNQ